MHQQVRPGAVGLSALGGGLGDSLLTENFDIYFRASSGLTNLGTMAGITLSLDGTASDDGDYFDIPTVASGVTATGFSGSLSYPISTSTMAGLNQATAIVCVDLSAITTPGSFQRLFGHKSSTSSNVAGLQIHSGTADLEPRAQVGDASTSLLADSAFDIAGEGKVVIFANIGWFFIDFVSIQVLDTTGVELAAALTNIDALDDFTVGTSSMSFFAGHDGTDSAGGVSGTRTLHGYGGAFTRGFSPDASQRAEIARSFA